MNRIILIFFLLLASLLIFSGYASARPLRAEIIPKKVGQGDVFLIRVTNVGAAGAPSAKWDGRTLTFDTCGEGCYVGVGAADIKMKPGRYQVRLSVGRKRKNLRLLVKKVRFPVVKMTLPEEKVILAPEDRERAERERERLEEIFRTVSDRMWEGRFLEPLGNELSTPFGSKRIMNGKWVSLHRGVDIRGKEGEEIQASNTGKVVLSEDLFFGGKTVVLDHGQGVFTIYMHLSESRVTTGDVVSKGGIIGRVGSSGRASGPHLHFGVRVTDLCVNPVSLLKLSL